MRGGSQANASALLRKLRFALAPCCPLCYEFGCTVACGIAPAGISPAVQRVLRQHLVGSAATGSVATGCAELALLVSLQPHLLLMPLGMPAAILPAPLLLLLLRH